MLLWFSIIRRVSVTSMKEYDVEVHLSEGDIVVDSTKNLTVAQVHI